MSIFKQKKEEIIIEPPSLGSFPDFTKKEIFTQGDAIDAFIKAYVKADKIQLDYLKIKPEKIKRVYLVGSGINYCAAVFGAYNFEILFDVISVAVSAGEFVYSNPILDKSTLVVMMGEDRRVTQRISMTPAKCVKITEGGDKRQDIVLSYTELGEFPTTAYTLSHDALSLLSLYLGEKTAVIDRNYVKTVLNELTHLSSKIKSVLSKEFLIKEVAKCLECEHMLFVGTNVDYSVALYASRIFTMITGKHICSCSLEDSFDYPVDFSLVAFASNMDFYSTLDNELNYQLKITSSLVKIIDEKTIFYNESLPIFNPLLSAVMIQIMLYSLMETKNKPPKSE